MDNQSDLNKLNTGLLFSDFEKTAMEPEYEAMDRMTKEHGVIQKRYQFSHDLVRALTEAKLTSKLRSLAKDAVSIDEKTFESEELITYYDGIFLDQVHQIKDKILRLVWWMMQDPKSPSQEPDNIGLKNFKPYEELLKKIGIYDLVHGWDQDLQTGIAVALRKRTQHHHFVSNLQQNSDFQNIKMSKSMLSPASVHLLSEYGRVRMKEIGEESYKKWEADIANKHVATLEAVGKNLNEISSKLIKYYDVPVDTTKYGEIINKYAESQKGFDIINKAFFDKIPIELKEALDFFISSCKEFFKDSLISIYLVGSIPRGEYIHGSSDINMIVITDFESHEAPLTDIDPRLDVLLFGEKEFLSERLKKYRFICWSDGIVLYGKEFKFDKREFPKPGTFLTLLLNRGFIDDLMKIKNEVAKLKNPSRKMMHHYSVKAAKIMLNFGFGVAMANKPYYTSSMKEKLRYVRQMFPSEEKLSSAYERVYGGGLIIQSDFSTVIDNFIESVRPNHERLLAVEEEILKEKEKEK
jgi:predicted nucleotidyltransferase